MGTETVLLTLLAEGILDKTRGEKTRFIRYEQIVNPGCRRTFVPGDLLSDLYGDKKGTKGNFRLPVALGSLRHPDSRHWFTLTHCVIRSFVDVGLPTMLFITCVRWYLRFKLSYRDLAELARELGVSVAPSTILRWVVRYVPEFEKCWQAYERPVGDSWRVDETYLKVGGQWMYLYRAVDKQGKTVESYLSRTRDVTAAKAFFRKALKRHGEPRVITLDGFEPTHAALRRMGMNNEFNYRWDDPVQIRNCPYLNNVVEQDHRRVKSRVSPMLGFKRFFNARRVLAGVEQVHKIIKGQFGLPDSFGKEPFQVWYNVLAA